MSEHVLLSLRAEDNQGQAVRYALALCRDLGARLTVLAVAEEDTANTHWLCVQEKLREEAQARMLPALEGALDMARSEGVECLVESRVGDFYDEVFAFAGHCRPHLVIVACPPPRKQPLRWCQERTCELRGRLHCPVVSLVPAQIEA